MSNIDTKQNTQNAIGNSDLRDNCCLMSLPEISCPTGKKTVKKKEVVLLDDSTVSSDKISGGQLDWYPQDKLTEFQTLRKQAYSLFDEYAIQVDKMYLVSMDNLDTILARLDDIKARWEQLVIERKATFFADIDAYKTENPSISKLVDDYQLPDSEFFDVFTFRYNPPLAFQPVFPEQEEQLAELARESLLKEIANEAGKQYKTSFTRGENVSQKAITALKRIRTKLVDMSFLETGVAYIVDTFDNVMQQLPKSGKIEGPLYHKLGHFVSQLSNEDNLKQAALGQDGINISAFYEQPEPEDDIQFEDNVPFENAAETPLNHASIDPFDTDIVSTVSANSFDNPIPAATHPEQSELDWCDF